MIATDDYKLFLIVFIVLHALQFEVKAAETVARDTCIVELLIPKGATTAVEGKPHRSKNIVWRNLNQGKVFVAEVEITLTSGVKITRNVIISGGKRIHRTVPESGHERPEVLLQSGHSGTVTALQYTPDGRYLISGGSDGTAILWDVATARKLRSYLPIELRTESSLRFGNAIETIAVEPNGQTISIGREDGTVTCWELATGNLLYRDDGILGRMCVCYFPEGRIIAYPSEVGIAFVAVANSKLEIAIQTKETVGNYIAISSDGKYLASVGSNGEIELWDAIQRKKHRDFRGHNGETIRRAIFSPDGRLLATAAYDHSIAIWNLEKGTLTHSLEHRFTPDGVVFTPDGKQCITCDSKSIRFWSVNSGKVLKTIEAQRNVESLAINATGDKLAGGLEDGQICEWDLRSNQLQSSFGAQAGDVSWVNFNEDGSKLLTVDSRAGVHVWDATSGARRSFSAVDLAKSAFFIPRSNRIAVHSYPREIRILDENAQTRVFPIPGFDSIDRIKLGPDDTTILAVGLHDKGHILAVALDLQQGSTRRICDIDSGVADARCVEIDSYDGERGNYLLTSFTGTSTDSGRTAILWDVKKGKKVRQYEQHFSGNGPVPISSSASFRGDGQAFLWGSWTISEVQSAKSLSSVEGHTGQVQAVAFSPSGDKVATGSWDKSVRIWNALNGHQLHVLHGHSSEVQSVDFNPSGDQLISGAWDGTAIIWNTQLGTIIRTIRPGGEKVWSVAYCPDGKSVVIGSSNHTATLWNVRTGAKLRTFSGHSQPVASVAVSHDGKIVVTGSGDDTAAAWDLQTGRQLRNFRGHSDSVMSVAISSNRKRLLTGSSDKTAILWDFETGRELHTLRWHSNNLTQVKFSPNDDQVLTTSWNNPAMLWNVDNGKRVRGFQSGAASGIPGIAFSPDGSKVLTGSLDRSAVIWDAASGDRVQTLSSPPLTTCASLNPTSDTVVVGAADGTISVYSAETGNKLKSSQHHTAAINSICYSPDGRFLMTGSDDGTARIQDAATGEPLLLIFGLSRGEEWLVMTPDGLFDGSAEARQLVSFRVGKGLINVPVDRFFQDFYYPGLLAAIFRGERPSPELKLQRAAPPIVKIKSPTNGDAESQSISVSVEALDQGGGVSKLAIYHNGARVLAKGDARQEGTTTFRTFLLSLVEGENRIRVTAANADGSWESEPAEIVLHFQHPVAKPELHLVAIGLNRYADANLNLRYAANDSHALAQMFQERGTSLYANVHATELSDDKATKQAIKQALRSAADATQPQDTLLLFLAGHGAMVGQRYYFVPYEFHPVADNFEDDLRTQGLAADELSDYLGSAKALKRVLILDTCASGGALGSVMKSRSGFALRGAIERLSRSQGIFTIAASAASDEAKEVEELGHGVLSYALLAGLKEVKSGPLDGNYVQPTSPDRMVNVMEWFGFAAGQVPRLTEKYFGASQDVQTSTIGTSFPILPLDE